MAILLHLAQCSSTNTGRENPDTFTRHNQNLIDYIHMKLIPIQALPVGAVSFLTILSCVLTSLHTDNANAETFLPEIIVRAENT